MSLAAAEIAPPRDRRPRSRRPRSQRLWAIGALVMSTACWGLATVMTKSVLAVTPPFTLLAIQLGASIAFLWIATRVTRQRVPFDRRSRRMALSGLLEPGLTYGLAVPGLALTSVTHASVIGAAEPALICVLAWAMLGDRPAARVLLAIMAAMAGVVLVTFTGAARPSAGGHAGDILILLGILCAALYVVVSSRLVAEIAPLPLVTLQQSVAFVFALVLLAGAWALGFEKRPAALPPGTILIAAVAGVMQYALAFWFYLIGLKALPVGLSALLLTLAPLFAIVGAMVFLGERLAPLQWLGGAVVLGAMIAIKPMSLTG